MARFCFLFGSIFAGLGVGAGAFGAHSLKATLAPDMLAVFETAVRYQMYHAFGLFAAGWSAAQAPCRTFEWAGRLFTLGICLFSGSLYLLSLSGVRWLGALTPLGGVAFIAGWAALGWGWWKNKTED